jgi:hypothetical protein
MAAHTMRSSPLDPTLDLAAAPLVACNGQFHAGDANRDGEFNSSDLIEVVAAGQYEDSIPGNSVWVTGDWDGDGDFTTSDLVAAMQAGDYEEGPYCI